MLKGYARLTALVAAVLAGSACAYAVAWKLLGTAYASLGGCAQ